MLSSRHPGQSSLRRADRLAVLALQQLAEGGPGGGPEATTPPPPDRAAGGRGRKRRGTVSPPLATPGSTAVTGPILPLSSAQIKKSRVERLVGVAMSGRKRKEDVTPVRHPGTHPFRMG